MEITAGLVKELRERTGIGMMECKQALKEAKGDIEEAITILRKKGFSRAQGKMSRETADGLVGSYIHMNGKLGVLVELNCESDFVARNEEFQELVKNVAMHIAAANPRFVAREDVPEPELASERDIIRDQFKDSNKPQEIVDKIVEGKLGKFFQEVCLMDQLYIKDDKLTVSQLIATFIAKFGENIRVKRFARYELGES